MTDPKLHHPYHRKSTCLLPHQGSHPVLAVTRPTGANLTFLLGYCPLPAPPVLSLTQEDFKVASSEQQGTLGQLGRVLPFFLCPRTTCHGSCAQVHLRCRHSPQHKPRHQGLGQGRQVRKETSTLRTPRPYLGHCQLLQYSVQHSGKYLDSPMLWHAISQTGPITIPTCHSVSSYKETQGWSTTKARGQSLRFSSLP